MTGRAESVVELAEACEAVDRAYSGWLDDPCRRTVEEVERRARVLAAVAAAVGRREAAAEVVQAVEDHGPGCDGPWNCVCDDDRPRCPNHGRMVPRGDTSPDHAALGAWFDCGAAGCRASALIPSAVSEVLA